MYVHVSSLAIGTPEFSIETMDVNHTEGIFFKEYTLDVSLRPHTVASGFDVPSHFWKI